MKHQGEHPPLTSILSPQDRGGKTPAPSELSLWLVALLALGHCLAFADRNLISVVAPLLKSEMGLSDTQIGILQGPAFAVLYAVGMIATLPLASSPRRFRLLAGCVAAWATGMAIFALVRSFPALCAARALVGLAQAAFVPLALALIVEGAAPRWRARSVAVFTAGAVIGRSVALLIGGVALALLARWLPASALPHWRLLFLVMLVPNAILIALLLNCRERPSMLPGAVVGLRQILAWVRRWPRLMLLYLCGAGCAVLVVQTVGAWAPSILHREHAMLPADAALAFGAALLVASPVGHLLAGTLVDVRVRRTTLPPTVVVAGGLLIAAPMLWAIPQADSPATACALMALISLAGGAAAVAALAGLPAILPPPIRGAGARLFLVFTTVVGVGLGPLAAGMVSDGNGRGGHGLSTALSLVCLTAATAGTLAALLIRNWHQAAAEATRHPAHSEPRP